MQHVCTVPVCRHELTLKRYFCVGRRERGERGERGGTVCDWYKMTISAIENVAADFMRPGHLVIWGP